MSDNIDKVLAQRGARYGDFSHHAELAQNLQEVMRSSGVKVSGEFWNKLTAVQKQALTVIADKIARILSGDPNYDDNWIDIQGYAKLVQERLQYDRAIDQNRLSMAEVQWAKECAAGQAIPNKAYRNPAMNRGGV